MRKLKRKTRADKFWEGLDSYAASNKNPLIRGYYSLDTVLAHLMVPALDHFIANQHGHPYEVAPDEWMRILTQIRDGFASHIRLLDLDYTNEEEGPLQEQVKSGLELFGKWYHHLWD